MKLRNSTAKPCRKKSHQSIFLDGRVCNWYKINSSVDIWSFGRGDINSFRFSLYLTIHFGLRMEGGSGKPQRNFQAGFGWYIAKTRDKTIFFHMKEDYYV